MIRFGNSKCELGGPLTRSRRERHVRRVAAIVPSLIARSRRLGIAVVAGYLAAAATVAAAEPAVAPAGTTLLSGSLALTAADSFGVPGFHQVLEARGHVPGRVTSARRLRLTFTLRDLGRPNQRCSTEHPLSGCATVDWADDPSRPKVPAGGVFSNRIMLRLGDSVETLYLRRSGTLARRPDSYAPG